jgi:hypothetical protein
LWCCRADGGRRCAKGSRASDTPVTTTVHDTGDPTLSTNYRIQSDGAGPYVTFSGVKDKVTSIIQTSSQCCQDWELDLWGSRTRRLLVDLRAPVPQNPGGAVRPAPPFEWEFVPGRLIVKCHLVHSTGFPGMTLGQSLDCPLLMTFPDPNSSSMYWRAALNPIGHPETDFAQVSCFSVTLIGRCSGWTVQSAIVQPDGELKNVARLEKVSTKGNASAVDHGPFYMTFSIQVTHP